MKKSEKILSYADQIKHPEWQKKRLEILNRDEFTCQQCGNKEETLHVHHKHYNNGAMIWQYQNWELTTKCKSCHTKTHEKKEPVKEKPNKYPQIIKLFDEKFCSLDIEFIFNILSNLPENYDEEIGCNEFLENLSICFGRKGFANKLFFDINVFVESEFNSINISNIRSFLNELNKD
jgi:hypothetical protein